MAEGRDVQWVEVSEGQVGQRIDNFLRTRLKGAPKSLIYRIVRKGEIRVNKKRVKADYRLELGDLVRIPPLRLAPEEAVREVSDGLRNLLAGSVLVDANAAANDKKPNQGQQRQDTKTPKRQEKAKKAQPASSGGKAKAPSYKAWDHPWGPPMDWGGPGAPKYTTNINL